MRSSAAKMQRDTRTCLAALLGAGLVCVPLTGAGACLFLALGLARSRAIGLDPGAALLLLTAIATALVLTWAAVAVAAGVGHGWAVSRSTTTASPVVAHAPTTRGLHGLLATAVAGLIAAVLATPAAAWSAGDAPTHGVSSSADRLGVSAALEPGPAPPADHPAPGGWEALADTPTGTDRGFVAPRAVDPQTAALLTGAPTRPHMSSAGQVVVTNGDSLWSLAAAHLGPGADDAEIARAWPAWWQANSATIGDDPDLLLPGQRLQIPSP